MSAGRMVPVAWRRRLKRMRSGAQFRFLGPRPVPRAPGEIRLLLVVRNEVLRLPFMLDYAFRLGVDRAIVLDNGSTDGTLDLLRARDRVHILQTRESYQHHGTWFDTLLHRYGVGHWCWMADADELLAYPHCDEVGLRGFTDHLDRRGFNVLSTLLVDMYPKGPTGAVRYAPGQDFREALPWFDPPNYRKIPFTFHGSRTTLDHRYAGGVRLRVFGQEICCTNFPLVKFHRGMFLPYGRHAVEGAVIPDIRGAILHYKFFNDFSARAMLEASRGEHYNDAAEYKAYAKLIRDTGDLDFWRPESVRYEGPGQLVRLGIMQSDAEWDRAASAPS